MIPENISQMLDDTDCFISRYAFGVPRNQDSLDMMAYAKEKGALVFALVENGYPVPEADFELLDAYWPFDGPVGSDSYLEAVSRMMYALDAGDENIANIDVHSQAVEEMSIGDIGEDEPVIYEINLGRIDN
jgi:hypothetical protein